MAMLARAGFYLLMHSKRSIHESKTSYGGVNRRGEHRVLA